MLTINENEDRIMINYRNGPKIRRDFIGQKLLVILERAIKLYLEPKKLAPFDLS